NACFEALLGDSIVYTPARFGTVDESLEAAQERKIRDVGEKLQLEAGDRLLDIGCGWGTLVANLAEQFEVDATGVTLSKNQTELASERIRARHLEDRARVLTLDYRDIPGPAYDKISCLEMAEHVGVKNFQKFLRQVSGLLEDDGLFFLQIVGLRRPPELGMVRNDRGGYWDASDFTWAMFMSKYIFPGADASLPLSFVAAQFEKAGFEIRSVENINVHYGMTIHRWYQNWMRNREKVIAGYGERWYRLWHLFLAWSVFTGVEGRRHRFRGAARHHLLEPPGEARRVVAAHRAELDLEPGMLTLAARDGATDPAADMEHFAGTGLHQVEIHF